MSSDTSNFIRSRNQVFVPRFLRSNFSFNLNVLVAFFLVFSCSNVLSKSADKTPDFGAITNSPTNIHYPGKAVWLDLLTTDVDAATEFYRNVFGWSFEFLEDKSYARASYKNHPIAAITVYDGENVKPGKAQWLISFSSNDIDGISKKVISAGGKILEGPFDLKGRGKMVVVRDSAGAELVFLSATGGDPKDQPSNANEWLWAELWTPEPKTAAKFYRDVLDFNSKTVKDSLGKNYMLLGRDGIARAGVVELTYENVEPNWLPYLLVEDVGATIATIKKFGGKLVLALSKNADSATTAIVSDSTGGVFAIQEKDQ